MQIEAHQRLIAEQFRVLQPQLRAATPLRRYAVELIGKTAAEPLIMRYEWLGNLGRSTLFVGLLSPERELHGVACFGYGPAGNVRQMLGESLCLERGACVHYAPANAASFLINAACKLVYRSTGIATFFAYADPMAGEYGGVYQAAGWSYLGQGRDGTRNRKDRCYVLPPGADPDNVSNWKTTRALRRGPSSEWLTFEQARNVGWRIALRAGKHLYAVHVGGNPKTRRAWRAKHGRQPYPAPRPELKLISNGSVRNAVDNPCFESRNDCAAQPGKD